MKSSTLKQLPTPAVTTSEGCLPGLASPEVEPATPGNLPYILPSSDWWVRQSAKQVMDADGQPLGFRHQLMHGRKVVRTGIGADFARTFREQASFLNGRSQRAQ